MEGEEREETGKKKLQTLKLKFGSSMEQQHHSQMSSQCLVFQFLRGCAHCVPDSPFSQVLYQWDVTEGCLDDTQPMKIMLKFWKDWMVAQNATHHNPNRSNMCYSRGDLPLRKPQGFILVQRPLLKLLWKKLRETKVTSKNLKDFLHIN